MVAQMIHKLLPLFMLIAAALGVTAGPVAEAKVEEVSINSASMRKDIKNVVILPEGYDSTGAPYPVVYLLHGYGGDEKAWLTCTPKLPEYASQMRMIIVCPDGKNSWYFDSPIDSTMCYETYVSTELPAYIDSKYNTIADPKGRAISGLSMGGHGALRLAFRHPGTFGAAGSTSGGVDIRPFPGKWKIAQALGPYAGNKKRWDENTVMTMVDAIPSGMPIIFDCGKSDIFIKENTKLHQELVKRQIPHSYDSGPGAHTPQYWKEHIPSHLAFFHDWFYNSETPMKGYKYYQKY